MTVSRSVLICRALTTGLWHSSSLHKARNWSPQKIREKYKTSEISLTRQSRGGVLRKWATARLFEAKNKALWSYSRDNLRWLQGISFAILCCKLEKSHSNGDLTKGVMYLCIYHPTCLAYSCYSTLWVKPWQWCILLISLPASCTWLAYLCSVVASVKGS